jgi:hypothetical protein
VCVSALREEGRSSDDAEPMRGPVMKGVRLLREKGACYNVSFSDALSATFANEANMAAVRLYSERSNFVRVCTYFPLRVTEYL